MTLKSREARIRKRLATYSESPLRWHIKKWLVLSITFLIAALFTVYALYLPFPQVLAGAIGLNIVAVMHYRSYRSDLKRLQEYMIEFD